MRLTEEFNEGNKAHRSSNQFSLGEIANGGVIHIRTQKLNTGVKFLSSYSLLDRISNYSKLSLDL